MRATAHAHDVRLSGNSSRGTLIRTVLVPIVRPERAPLKCRSPRGPNTRGQQASSLSASMATLTALCRFPLTGLRRELTAFLAAEHIHLLPAPRAIDCLSRVESHQHITSWARRNESEALFHIAFSLLCRRKHDRSFSRPRPPVGAGAR
jgi:hypothetical protein